MLLNDQQLLVSRSTLEKLQNSLELLQRDNLHSPSATNSWRIAALSSQVSELENEIRTYESLKRQEKLPIRPQGMDDLPQAIVEKRIFLGRTQEQEAAILGIDPIDYFRCEADEFVTADEKLIKAVADSLEIDYGIPPASQFAEIIENFPLNEMLKRGWFSVAKNKSLEDAALAFLQSYSGSRLNPALHRKKVRSGSTLDENALFAWQIRILQLSYHNENSRERFPINLSNCWLPELVKLSTNQRGPLLARDFLWQKGIDLIIEPRLEGTHLDGAAMISESGRPIVALTLRHDRIDNFWFTLMHELGHVILHLSSNPEFDFFDEEDSAGDEYETEADQFSLNTLISPSDWDTCVSRFTRTKEAILSDASRLGIHPAILAGRLRNEKGDWYQFNDLVGHNTVRWMFEES